MSINMKNDTLQDSLASYIDEVAAEKFSAITNNCLYHVLKVVKKANIVNVHPQIWFAWTKTPPFLHRFVKYTPHFFMKIGNLEIDKFYAEYWGNNIHLKGKLFVTDKFYDTPYPNVLYTCIVLWRVAQLRFHYNMGLVLLYAPFSLVACAVMETLLWIKKTIEEMQ